MEATTKSDFHIFDSIYLYWELVGRRYLPSVWCEGGNFKWYVRIWRGGGNYRADGGSSHTSWCYSWGQKVTAERAHYGPTEAMSTVKSCQEERSMFWASSACSDALERVFLVGILSFLVLSPSASEEKPERGGGLRKDNPSCTYCFSHLKLQWQVNWRLSLQ